MHHKLLTGIEFWNVRCSAGVAVSRIEPIHLCMASFHLLLVFRRSQSSCSLVLRQLLLVPCLHTRYVVARTLLTVKLKFVASPYPFCVLFLFGLVAVALATRFPLAHFELLQRRGPFLRLRLRFDVLVLAVAMNLSLASNVESLSNSHGVLDTVFYYLRAKHIQEARTPGLAGQTPLKAPAIGAARLVGNCRKAASNQD